MANGRVFVIDDDEAVRDSLSMLLRAEGLDVEVHSSANSFLATYETNADRDAIPSCVLTDVRMPGMDGLSLQRHLSQAFPNLPVIIVTGHGDLPMAVDAMKSGAADFVEKPYAASDIVSRVNEAILAAPKAGQTPGAAETKQAAHEIAKLSPREREVFDYLVVGYTNKEIARRLDISPRTVEVHRAHIMGKTGARGLSQLVRMALAAGLPLKED